MPNEGSGSCHLLKVSGNLLLGMNWWYLGNRLCLEWQVMPQLPPCHLEVLITVSLSHLHQTAPVPGKHTDLSWRNSAPCTVMAHALGRAPDTTSSCAWRLLGLIHLAAPFYKPCLLVWSEFSSFFSFSEGQWAPLRGDLSVTAAWVQKLLTAIHPLGRSCLVVQKPHNYLTSSAIKTSACVGVVFCLDCSNRLSVCAPCCFLTAGFDKPFGVTAALLIFWLFTPSSYYYFMLMFIWPHTDSTLTVTN